MNIQPWNWSLILPMWGHEGQCRNVNDRLFFKRWWILDTVLHLLHVCWFFFSSFGNGFLWKMLDIVVACGICMCSLFVENHGGWVVLRPSNLDLEMLAVELFKRYRSMEGLRLGWPEMVKFAYRIFVINHVGEPTLLSCSSWIDYHGCSMLHVTKNTFK